MCKTHWLMYVCSIYIYFKTKAELYFVFFLYCIFRKVYNFDVLNVCICRYFGWCIEGKDRQNSLFRIKLMQKELRQNSELDSAAVKKAMQTR